MPYFISQNKNKRKSKNIVTKNRKSLLFVVFFAIIGGYFIFRSFANETRYVGLVKTKTNKGYWLVRNDGVVTAKGDASILPVIGPRSGYSATLQDIAVRPQGDGYWTLSGTGQVVAYGSSGSGIKHNGNGPAVERDKFYSAIVSTPSGEGYWLITSIGTAFGFGDAKTAYAIDFKKTNYSVAYGGIAGTSGIVDADRTPSGKGLIFLDKSGRVYFAGDVVFRGSPELNTGDSGASISLDATTSYLITSTKGLVYSFGTGTAKKGDLTGRNIEGSIVGLDKFGQAQDNSLGYWLLSTKGGVYNFGQAQHFGNGEIPNDNTDEDGNTYNGGSIDECRRYTMQTKDKGTCVKIAQQVLKNQNYVVDINSNFDLKTLNAVKKFQTDKQITQTGKIDTPTWGKLAGNNDDDDDDDQRAEIPCEGNGIDGYRVQVVYMYNEGSPDKFAEFEPKIKASAIRINRFVLTSARRSGGDRQIRYVHSADCKLDIKKVKISSADKSDSLMSYALKVGKYGMNSLNRKYLIFLDHTTSGGACGLGGLIEPSGAQIRELVNKGVDLQNFVNPDPVKNAFDNISGFGMFPNFTLYGGTKINCFKPIAAAGELPTDKSDVVLHELMHAFGAVPKEAPHTTASGRKLFGHCSDDYDNVCYEDNKDIPLTRSSCPKPSDNFLLDCGHNDYFAVNPKGSYLPTSWNIANSKYLIK